MIMLTNTIQKIMARDCTGCGACANVCPRAAITMQYDEEGFIFPKINEQLCINCGLCYKICPTKEAVYKNTDTPEAYAVMADDETRMRSSSGGLFSLLANIHPFHPAYETAHSQTAPNRISADHRSIPRRRYISPVCPALTGSRLRSRLLPYHPFSSVRCR